MNWIMSQTVIGKVLFSSTKAIFTTAGSEKGWVKIAIRSNIKENIMHIYCQFDFSTKRLSHLLSVYMIAIINTIEMSMLIGNSPPIQI